jgi:hypothetical protein
LSLSAATVPVGYIVGSDRMTALGQSAPWLGSAPVSVVPASSVAADKMLGAGPVPLQILGLFPGMPAKNDPSLTGVLVDALFPLGAQRLPFGAWSMTCRPVAKCSSNLRFSVPADRAGGIDLRFTQTAPTGQRSTLSARMNTRSAGGAQLRRGYYLLGLRPGLWTKATTLNPAGPPDLSKLSLVVAVGM